MNAPSIDIKNMLESYGDSSGLSLDLGNNLYIGREPATPINCVTIYDTGGFSPDLGLNNQGYERPSIQIRIRNEKYVDGWNLAHAIMTALHGRSHEIWGGTLYTVIYCSSGPALLEWDDHNRVKFIINFNLQRR